MNFLLGRSVLVSLVTAPMVVSMLALCYFTLLERAWLVYSDPVLRVLGDNVLPGQPVVLLVRRCNRDSRVHTYLISHTLVSLDSQRLPQILEGKAATIAPGCSTVESRINVIPLGTPPGRYLIEGASEVNGTLRNLSVGWVSDPFTVRYP